MRNLQCVTAVVLLLAATSCAARTLQQTPHEECVFPFMHEGEERNECVVVDGELMCKDNLEHFIDCESGDHRHDHEEDDHSHDSCEFPFLHEGRNFTECLLLDRQPVCKDDLGHWLNCGTGHHLDEDEEDDHAHDEDEEDDHDDHDEDEDEDEDHDHDEDEDHDHDEDEDHDHDEDEDEDHDEDEDEDHNDGINVRICTVGDQEQEFCEAMGPVMSAALAGSGFSFSCMEYNSADDCLTAIASGDVDIRSVDSSDIFHAWSAHGLRAIAHEVYEEGPSGGEFYSVALVRSEFCDDSGFVGLHSLAGTRSCHVGYRNMAGWRLPLGDLMAQDHVAVVSDQSNVENDAETMASYFSSICAPRTSGNGPVNTEDGSGALWDPLCSGCTSPDIENEADRCTVHDPYYSYTGAFRCLAEGAGDVAFVKHSTVLDYAADGRTPAAWATDGMDAFRLLCPSGGCAPVDDYSGCNLAQVPAHAVMASPLRSFVEDGSLAGALELLGSDADFSSMVFNASANPRDFIFKGTAIALNRVTGDTGSYLGTTALALEFLGTVESN